MDSPDTSTPPGDSLLKAARVLRRVSNELNSELTPGLIHEVNNVLTGIYFNLEALQESAQPGSDGAERLGEIGRGVERIKDILGRATQIHLNVAEREVGYHDLESLVSSELDLLRVVFPKTAKISFLPPAEPVNVRMAQFPFRVAMLTVASRIRDLFPTGKIEIPVAVLASPQLENLFADSSRAIPKKSVGVSFTLPCPVESADEIDDYLIAGTGGDLSMQNAMRIFSDIGGEILFHSDPAVAGSTVILLLPRYDLKP